MDLKMTTSTDLNYYFSDTTKDNKGNTVTDINKGLTPLFVPVNDSNVSEIQRYLVSDFEDGYPELVSKNSAMNSTEYWWWLLLLNGLDDPLAGIKANWIYSINSQSQIDEINADIDSIKSSVEKSRIGETVELN